MSTLKTVAENGMDFHSILLFKLDAAGRAGRRLLRIALLAVIYECKLSNATQAGFANARYWPDSAEFGNGCLLSFNTSRRDAIK